MTPKLPPAKLSPRMIALDLDDTLLKADLSISTRTAQSLRAAAERCIYVVLCSGRPENSMLPFVRYLSIAGIQAGRYMVCDNGSTVYDLHLRDKIYHQLVDYDILSAAYRRASAYGLLPEVYDGTTIYVSRRNRWTDLDAKLSRYTVQLEPDFAGLLKKGFAKMIIPGEPPVLQTLQTELKAAFGGRAVIFTSKPYFLELLPAQCGKGEALLWLAEKLSVPSSEIMSFGDSMNDESMMNLTGMSVAMQNGLPAIQEAARFVTRCSNEEDGVADFIEEFVL